MSNAVSAFSFNLLNAFESIVVLLELLERLVVCRCFSKLEEEEECEEDELESFSANGGPFLWVIF